MSRVALDGDGGADGEQVGTDEIRHVLDEVVERERTHLGELGAQRGVVEHRQDHRIDPSEAFVEAVAEFVGERVGVAERMDEPIGEQAGRADGRSKVVGDHVGEVVEFGVGLTEFVGSLRQLHHRLMTGERVAKRASQHLAIE